MIKTKTMALEIPYFMQKKIEDLAKKASVSPAVAFLFFIGKGGPHLNFLGTGCPSPRKERKTK